MNATLNRRSVLAFLALPLIPLAGCDVAGAAGMDRPGTAFVLPDPTVTSARPAAPGNQTAVFAGGCFWGVQAVFQRIKGVVSATSGYAGGAAKFADYRSVSTGSTGHAEAVQVVFDPVKISFDKLLKVFMSVAHNPTQLNYQGPDHGTQYRSAIFTVDADQQKVAKAYIDQLNAAKAFPEPVVTQLTPLSATPFYKAEDYHQDYLDKNPTQPYIVMHDKPKLVALEKTFPALYRPLKG
ncbi:peptide-methionine (S)-S-oxide reductase MsrA [soil metagenome]